MRDTEFTVEQASYRCFGPRRHMPTSWCFFEIMKGLPVTIGLPGTLHKFLANTDARSREWPHHNGETVGNTANPLMTRACKGPSPLTLTGCSIVSMSGVYQCTRSLRGTTCVRLRALHAQRRLTPQQPNLN